MWGFTAILGHKIQLPVLVLVWWRIFITCLTILLTSQTLAKTRLLPRRLVWQYVGIGCIVVVHWICFYGSIKLANASVALI
ncbi:MAG: EamA/RhaT family transporter, partial [Saprospiraceae bacterium]|nr:EamA/RhaT family transporter [Saprospiraceae bacterium]